MAKRDLLPDGETGVAINELFVVSTVPKANGRSSAIIRDRLTLQTTATVDLPIWVSAGALTPRALVVTGYEDASAQADGGLVKVDLSTFGIESLAPVRPFPKELRAPVARGDVLVSPSGRFAASNICGVDICDTQVIDLETNEVFRPVVLSEGYLRTLTDDLVVTTDDQSAWISAIDFRTSNEVWRERDSILMDPVAGADGSVVGLVGSPKKGWGIGQFSRDGRLRNLGPRVDRTRPWPRIWTPVSTPELVVVGTTSFEEALSAGVDQGADFIAVRGGTVTATDAIVIVTK